MNRKLVAIVLALFGPWGVGHFHLGRRILAGVWLAIPSLGLMALGALVPVIGPRFGWGVAVVLPVALMVGAWLASFIDLLRLPDSLALKVPVWQTVGFFVLGLAAPVVASAFVRVLVLEAFVVPTQSMQPTVLAGDRIFASKSDRRARYGDVIVFKSPEHPDQMLVKRVMAMPNDVLELQRGRPFINGWKVPSCTVGNVTLDGESGELDVEFLGEASYLVFYDSAVPVAQHAGPLYASSDGVLVLGDDRNDSADSRTWHGGLDGNVSKSALRGRALFVWLRLNPSDDRRFGIDLSGVALPSSLEAVRPDVDRCLAAPPPAFPPPAFRH